MDIKIKPFNPNVLSKCIVKKEVIEVPKKDNSGLPLIKYALHFYTKKGDILIKYNSEDNHPDLLLYESARWNVRCFNRDIEKIFISGVEDNFITYIIIEKLP